jgi:uncharacterized protein (DUF983 family)
MPKKSSTAAIIQGKCPRCRQGEVFSFPAYNLANFNKMNHECPHCGVRLEPEPGFYQGAMYFSYAFLIVCMVIVGVLLYYLAGDPSEWVYIGTVIAIMILGAPLNYRYSRILYLHLFGGIKYNPSFDR